MWIIRCSLADNSCAHDRVDEQAALRGLLHALSLRTDPGRLAEAAGQGQREYRQATNANRLIMFAWMCSTIAYRIYAHVPVLLAGLLSDTGLIAYLASIHSCGFKLPFRLS